VLRSHRRGQGFESPILHFLVVKRYFAGGVDKAEIFLKLD
jgi:hypothetical protein